MTEFLIWVIETFTTDEGRLPVSSNTNHGGMTIFIDHEEYPISVLEKRYELHLENKIKK